MRTVTTISLNGNAYQLDTSGCEALGAYLQVAEQRLAENPDRQEILADLEQAIADKFGRYLSPHKNVVSAGEVAEALHEMGPVDGGAPREAASGARAADADAARPAGAGAGHEGAAAAGMGGAERTGEAGAAGAAGAGAEWTGEAGAAGAAGAGAERTAQPGAAGAAAQAAGAAGAGEGVGAGPGGAPRRLYQISEGALISGVCNGLAAYFRIDVTVVRLLFVVFTFVTWGAGVLVYLVLTFVIPHARTSEEHAAAHGQPFNAEELIGRGSGAGAGFKHGSWQQHWREQRRTWRERQRAWRSQQRLWRRQQRAWTRFGAPQGPPPPAPPPWAAPMHPAQRLHGVFSPFTALVGALLFAGFLFVLISIINRHAVLGWAWPGDLPRWLGIVILIVLYRAIAWPLHAARYAPWYAPPGAAGWAAANAALATLMWLAFVAVMAWLAWQHWPQVLDFLHRLADAWRAAFTPAPTQASVTL